MACRPSPTACQTPPASLAKSGRCRLPSSTRPPRTSLLASLCTAAPPSAPFRLPDRTWRGKRNRWEEQWQCRRRVNPRSSRESAPLEHRSEEEQLISDGGACSERHHCLLGRMLSSKGRLASSSRTSLLGLGRVEHVSTRCQRGIGD